MPRLAGSVAPRWTAFTAAFGIVIVMRAVAVFVVFVLCVVGLLSTGAHAQSSGGATDSAFDWEKPPAKPSPDRYALTTFKSARTLAETTKWLKGALERYGKKKERVDDFEISNVRFAGCTMEWTFRQELTGGVTQISTYAVSLRDVDLAYGAVQVSTETVQFRTKREFTVLNKYFEKGVQKPTGTDKESSVQLRMRNNDLIPDRVSWALVHAARLCGAEVPAPR
jgi:hypothetical protein